IPNAAGRSPARTCTTRNERTATHGPILQTRLQGQSMSVSHTNTYPKLHNAMWPGLVGKGSEGAEPTIDLDTMLNLTAAAEVDGIKFDGVDIFLYEPHINIDINADDLKAIAARIAGKGFMVGSVVAPVWFDASAMGDQRQRENYLTAVRKACRIAKDLRELGVRPYGI